MCGPRQLPGMVRQQRQDLSAPAPTRKFPLDITNVQYRADTQIQYHDVTGFPYPRQFSIDESTFTAG